MAGMVSVPPTPCHTDAEQNGTRCNFLLPNSRRRYTLVLKRMASHQITHADLQAAGLKTDSARSLLGAKRRVPPTAVSWAIYDDELSEAAEFAGGDYIVPRRFFGVVIEDEVELAVEVEVDRGRFLFRQLVERMGHGFELDDNRNDLTNELVKMLSGFVAFAVRQTRDGIKVEPVRSDRAGPTGWWAAYASEAKPHKPQRGRRLEPEHFERVADRYRVAIQTGEPPTQAVADTFQVPYSTAGRWVMETRRRGFLAAAPAPGQPGEKRDTDG